MLYLYVICIIYYRGSEVSLNKQVYALAYFERAATPENLQADACLATEHRCHTAVPRVRCSKRFPNEMFGFLFSKPFLNREMMSAAALRSKGILLMFHLASWNFQGLGMLSPYDPILPDTSAVKQLTSLLCISLEFVIKGPYPYRDW